MLLFSDKNFYNNICNAFCEFKKLKLWKFRWNLPQGLINPFLSLQKNFLWTQLFSTFFFEQFTFSLEFRSSHGGSKIKRKIPLSRKNLLFLLLLLLCDDENGVRPLDEHLSAKDIFYLNLTNFSANSITQFVKKMTTAPT